MRLRQFVPLLFISWLMLSLLMTPVSTAAGLVLALTLGIYAFANIFASLITVRQQGWRMRPALPLCFATIHFAFGLGFLAGLAGFRNRWGDRESRGPR
jgi:4-hydroxybenzoate polyprenyltransferase